MPASTTTQSRITETLAWRRQLARIRAFSGKCRLAAEEPETHPAPVLRNPATSLLAVESCFPHSRPAAAETSSPSAEPRLGRRATPSAPPSQGGNNKWDYTNLVAKLLFQLGEFKRCPAKRRNIKRALFLTVIDWKEF